MFKKILDSIKYIKLYDFLSIFIFIFMIVPSLIFKIINKFKNRKLLLVTEDGKTARDNGYHFYKYVRTVHPDDYCFYVIEKKSDGYNNVKEFENIIQFKSLKHWLYYMSADYNISNHKNGNPSNALFYVLHVYLNMFNNRVFLQHGITKDNAEWLYYKNTKFKYFICGAKREYEYIKNKFGYPKRNVIYTGFARFDNLYDNNINKKQILIMPTWRQWLGRETNNLGVKVDFNRTNYYKYWSALLNNKVFTEYIEEKKLEVLFYPHANMQKYLKYFKVKSKNIKVLDLKYDIQKVLKESAIMITDYSSVYMDFAYMIKPILYYQFDYEEYRKKQYQDGYFDYVEDGFGPVCDNVEDLVNEFIKIFDNGLNIKYEKRMKYFFEIRDKKNCERIYNTINNIKNVGGKNGKQV